MRDPWASYDEWKTTPPNAHEKPVAACVQCGTELYEGEECFEGEDGYFCDDVCVWKFYHHHVRSTFVKAPEPDDDDFYD